MLARLDPRTLDRIWFPLGDADEGGDPRRGRLRRGSRRRTAGEPGGVLPRGRRLPVVSRPAGARRDGRARSSTRPGSVSASTTATGSSRRASGAGSASRRRSRSMRSRPTRARTRSSSGRAPRSRGRASRLAGGSTCPSIGSTAKLRYRSPAVPATVEQTANGFRLQLDEPAYGVARGQAAVLYEGDVVVGAGLVTSAAAD